MDEINSSLLPTTPQTTVEDLLNYRKSEIQTFLKQKRLRINGNKLELAQRVVALLQSQSSKDQTQSDNQVNNNDFATALNDIPCISDLQSGWTGKTDTFPNVTIKDVEHYLLHSSHRTEDSGKMQCYRQYIRGLNFYKEGYIHKIMMNDISPTSSFSYIRSKCYPSMKKGAYEQWLLVKKETPFQILKANCTCPAG